MRRDFFVMKRIFLIGDSIRIGYDQYVRELMADTAQLYWPEDNARFAGYTLRYLHEWAGHDCDPKAIDVVHWNNGLWDALHVLGEDAQTPAPEYAQTLRRIARRLKNVFPNARIVFALTTFVIEERMNPLFYRRNGEIERYNAAARAVMAEERGPAYGFQAPTQRTSPQSRLKDGSRRITYVTEVVGMEGDTITLQDIFVFDYRAGIDENGRFRGIIQSTGLRPRFLERLSDQGVHFPTELFQNEIGSVPLAMRR